MTPLNIYLRDADKTACEQALIDYGQAIKELAGANIFPGDMLQKNFGVTRNGRVVFYDYDEICYLSECNFRHIPPPTSWEDELSDQVWYSVKANDVFPEQFERYFCNDIESRTLFAQHHKELTDADYWRALQQRLAEGCQDDIFPYPEQLRFKQNYTATEANPPLKIEHAAA